MYRRVLLCYDGSRESRDALRLGGELVAALKAETHVLLVSNVTHRAAAQGVTVESQLQAERSTCNAILQEGLAWLRERGVEATPHIVLGSPSEVIPRIARELEVDLVVVGHIARARLARWWAGPENASLLDRLRCSVLVTVA
jgi:nucleotide-binding universal stress UspA family protein